MKMKNTKPDYERYAESMVLKFGDRNKKISVKLSECGEIYTTCSISVENTGTVIVEVNLDDVDAGIFTIIARVIPLYNGKIKDYRDHLCYQILEHVLHNYHIMIETITPKLPYGTEDYKYAAYVPYGKLFLSANTEIIENLMVLVAVHLYKLMTGEIIVDDNGDIETDGSIDTTAFFLKNAVNDMYGNILDACCE